MNKKLTLWALVACAVFLIAATLPNMVNLSSPTSDDIMYIVDNPGGAAADRKITVANLRTWILQSGDLNLNGVGISNVSYLAFTNSSPTMNSSEILLSGTKTYDYMGIPANAFSPPATNPATATTNLWPSTADSKTSELWSFPDSATKYVEYSLPAPPGWDLGTVKWKLNLSMTNTAGTNVFAIRGAGSRGGAWGTPVYLTNIMGTVAGTNVLTSASAAMTFGGTLTKDKMLSIQVYRVPSDAADGQVGSVELHAATMELSKTNSTTSLW